MQLHKETVKDGSSIRPDTKHAIYKKEEALGQIVLPQTLFWRLKNEQKKTATLYLKGCA